MMRRLGYFVTESSEHNAEYSPYFIPHGQEMIAKFDVPIDEYLRRCDGIVDEFERMKTFSRSDEPMEVRTKSTSTASTIIHSMVTGKPARRLRQYAEPGRDLESAGRRHRRGADAGGSRGLAVHDGRRAAAAA